MSCKLSFKSANIIQKICFSDIQYDEANKLLHVAELFCVPNRVLSSAQVQLCALRAQAEYGDHGHANNFDYK